MFPFERMYCVHCTMYMVWSMPRWPPGTFTKEAKPWFRLVAMDHGMVLGASVSSFT